MLSATTAGLAVRVTYKPLCLMFDYMLEDGFSYPVRGDWLGRVVIGGVLGLFSGFLIPLFFMIGYLIKVLKSTVTGESDPPPFKNWGALLRKGFFGTLIALAYSLPPVAVFGGIGMVLSNSSWAFSGQSGWLLGNFGGLTVILILPAMIITYYLVPAALTNYAIGGHVGDAFEFHTIKPVLLSSDYLLAVLTPIVVGVVLLIVTLVLAVTVVGLLLLPFVQFYGQVAVFRMFGTAFRAADNTYDSEQS